MILLKFLSFLIIFALPTSCSPTRDPLTARQYFTPFADTEFSNYLLEHNLTVSWIDSWPMYREYQVAKRIVESHNEEADRGLHSYKLGLNHFSAEPEDLRVIRNGAIVVDATPKEFVDVARLSRQFNVPASVDYRADKCMTHVKKQGSCGSCWSFAANTPVEFRLCKANQTLTSLSEQQLVDCAPPYNGNSNGCHGGFYTNAWNYIKAAPGQAVEHQYPYTSKGGQSCYYSPSMSTVNLGSIKWIPPNDEDALKIAVAAKGPISIVVHVNRKFMFYKSGIFDDPKCPDNQPNHAMVLVGFGTDLDSAKEFWIIRNSWSTTWGENGYMRLRRGVNRCGIASHAAYVEIK